VRSKAQQYISAVLLGLGPSLVSDGLLKQSPRDRPRFLKRQKSALRSSSLQADAHSQSVHAIFEQTRLRIAVTTRRHATPKSTRYAIFTFLMISKSKSRSLDPRLSTTFAPTWCRRSSGRRAPDTLTTAH
jgi:hypothetical protein